MDFPHYVQFWINEIPFQIGNAAKTSFVDLFANPIPNWILI